MWAFIFGGLAVGSVLGIVYLGSRFAKFQMVRKVTKGKKILGFLVGLVLVVALRFHQGLSGRNQRGHHHSPSDGLLAAVRLSRLDSGEEAGTEVPQILCGNLRNRNHGRLSGMRLVSGQPWVGQVLQVGGKDAGREPRYSGDCGGLRGR